MKKTHRVGVTNPSHVNPKQGASSGAAKGLKGAPRVILVSENANLCRRQHQSVVQGDFTLERKSFDNPGRILRESRLVEINLILLAVTRTMMAQY